MHLVQGWGCGYRSLQSLCSWAVTQRQRKPGAVRDEGGEKMKQGESATVKEWVVPSVGEIQDTLVEVGDKPAEFAGSREWIGCFEACLVLDHLFSVSLCMYHLTITEHNIWSQNYVQLCILGRMSTPVPVLTLCRWHVR